MWGNPTTYLGHTLTWEKGRQLKSFDSNTYTYNANGIRTSKTVNGVKHTYTLDGTKILRETWGDNTLIPLYDNEDSVCGILYNDTPYYFLKNLQGDVIAIADKDGQVVVEYSYLFAYCSNNVVNEHDLLGNLGISSLLSVIDDAFSVVMSIAETGIKMDKPFQKLEKKIKSAKTRRARKALMKEQKKLLIHGVGKGLYLVTRIIGYIALVAPFAKSVLAWSKDKILFVEFIVTIIIELIKNLLSKLTSWLIGLVPVAGIILGFAGSWLIEKLLDMHYSNSRITKISKYFSGQLSKLTSAKKWFNAFVYALQI